MFCATRVVKSSNRKNDLGTLPNSMAKDLSRKPQKVNATVVFGKVKLSPKMAFEQSLVFQVPSENGCYFGPPNSLRRQNAFWGVQTSPLRIFEGFWKTRVLVLANYDQVYPDDMFQDVSGIMFCVSTEFESPHETVKHFVVLHGICAWNSTFKTSKTHSVLLQFHPNPRMLFFKAPKVT